jgi:hypothetical protein
MKILVFCSLLVFSLFSSSCSTKKPPAAGLKIGRVMKDNGSLKKIERAEALYEMGEIDAAVALLERIINHSRQKVVLLPAYELIVRYLLEIGKHDEAHRFASYFLKSYPKEPAAERIIRLFDSPQKSQAKKESSPEEVPAVHVEEIENVKAENNNNNNIQIKTVEKSRSIAIILPLSGPLANYGKRALLAMTIGFDMPLYPPEASTYFREKGGLKVFVADSGANSENAKHVAEKLIAEHKISVLIGDISNEASLALAQLAEKEKIPLYCLSRHSLFPGFGPFTFSFSASPEKLIEFLVEQAMNVRGIHNFAIFFPKTNYGKQMARLFYDQVLKSKGSINAVAAYDPHETNFGAAAKLFLGKHPLEARGDYHNCIRLARSEALDKSAQAKAQKSCMAELKPIVDFQGLFMPDFNKLAFIIPSLLQEDLIAGKKATNVQFLGANSWNEPGLLARIASLSEGALFVDSINLRAKGPLEVFRSEFLKASLGDVSALEFYAHDAAKVAKDIIMGSTELLSPEEIRKRTLDFKKNIGLIGLISFDENGDLHSSPIAFEIDKGEPVVLSGEKT